MYLDFTNVFDISINTLADLDITMTFYIISRYKTTISKKHVKTVNSIFVEYMKNTMILNIDNYHSIHMKRMLNTTTISITIHLITILMNLIMTQYVISKINIYNSVLVNVNLIKTNMKNKFISLCSFSYN